MRTIHRDIVGAFIFSNDGHILLGKSGKGGVYQGLWVVPGGGIEPSETPLQAMRREAIEEVGIDLTPGTTTAITEDIQTGSSVKTLRDTGETVQVEMRFHDFIVEMPFPASEVAIELQDELETAEWLALNDLTADMLSPGVAYRLRRLGYLQ